MSTATLLLVNAACQVAIVCCLFMVILNLKRLSRSLRDLFEAQKTMNDTQGKLVEIDELARQVIDLHDKRITKLEEKL